MQTRAAIENLTVLKGEADQQGLALKASDTFASWKGRVVTSALVVYETASG